CFAMPVSPSLHLALALALGLQDGPPERACDPTGNTKYSIAIPRLDARPTGLNIAKVLVAEPMRPAARVDVSDLGPRQTRGGARDSACLRVERSVGPWARLGVPFGFARVPYTARCALMLQSMGLGHANPVQD